MEYFPLIGGLDPSWQYMINKAAIQRMPFFYPPGLLGFIKDPLPLGYNLEIAILVRLVVWIALCVGFNYLIIKENIPLLNLLVFAGIFAFGSSISFDYLVSIGLVILLFQALSHRRWQLLCGIVAVLSGLLSLLKVNAAVLAISCCVMFFGIKALIDRRNALRAALILGAGIPFVFCGAYLLYDPSIKGLFTYIQMTLDISSGYSIGMSVPGAAITLWAALGISLSYLGLAGWLWFKREKVRFLALIGFPVVFFAFKHGFVRQDGHEATFFAVMAVLVGVIFLFLPMPRFPTWGTLFMLPVLIPFLFLPEYTLSPESVAGIGKVQDIYKLLDYERTQESLQETSLASLQQYRLPASWLQRLQDHSISIFPWEAAYAPANDLNYHMFPVIQTFFAYTARLDEVNADFLKDQATAPDFLLMEWKAIDDRHALMDVPAMWLAIYQWYEVAEQHPIINSLLLLQRRSSPRFGQLESVRQDQYDIHDFLEIPESDRPMLIKCSLHLNFWGRLAKIFFRIPEVTLDIIGSAGQRTYRVIPDTLENGLFINFLPFSLQDIKTLCQDDQTSARIYGVRFSGPGSTFYKPALTAEWYTIPNVHVDELRSTFDATSLSPAEPGSITFDVYNVYLYESEQTASPSESPPAFLIVDGWAVDSQAKTCAGGVYLDIDGTLWPTYYGGPSYDIAASTGISAYEACGFQIGVPASKLGKGPHTLRLRLLNSAKTAYASSEGSITFELK